MHHLFTVPVTHHLTEFEISCSVGMSTYPEDGDSYDALVRNADMAMSYAKSHGKNRLVEFNTRMGQDNLRRIGMEQHLKEAIRRDEFSLCYQPKIATSGHEMVGMEVLLRWHNEALGAVSPAEFIPIAEQSHLILEIGDWVLEQAMQQNLAWQRQGLPLLPLGVKISIDDFGTGYSNLGYLSRFPLDVVKIDRSFVTRIDERRDNQQIVRAIVQLARSLSLALVAEGVETEAELAFVSELGVEVVQGYHFSRPLPAEALMRYLEQARVLV